ncbi:SDR family NAD(P)-dependent oxidoreductase [Thalassotalea euphylliae]|uniref:SDR family NAD(P)-dependent oxidoreductase n=1 Tax=Thalassotalea euphylliae TaxID=1655234 RepID=A0A3E0TUV0_9GAMM|nr:SDR family NAD(P)-dependent oxidoreductase [Thalassotalea euphylliae]REL27712.1 SDR family NAD(P)-dependent oxidoreductase [Thalassotalea euphylliae]
MKKTILITGATDGIGLVTATMLAEQGHHVLIHGRSTEKLAALKAQLESLTVDGERAVTVSSYQADLSKLTDVALMAAQIKTERTSIDVVINNAGVFHTPETMTADGFDMRFMVNTFSPYLLTKLLLPLMKGNGRVVNLSSAAQAPVNVQGMVAGDHLTDNAAYAQSKLAITMWTNALAAQRSDNEPLYVAINPKSFLGSKMVKEAYGVAGGDLRLGADILVRAALSDEFNDANGQYFDNDNECFASPHPDALDERKCHLLAGELEKLVSDFLS